MDRLPWRNLLAGCSIAGLMLPEAVAYAGIAGLLVGRALAAAIVGGLAYALVGRSRFAVVSPTSSSAAILAASLAGLSAPSDLRDTMTTAMTLMVGAIFLGLAFFRLGSLAGFISRPVLRGFAFGLAVTITIRQLSKLAGVATPPGPVWRQLGELIVQAASWHWWSVALGLAAFGALVGLRRIPRMPAALLVLVAGIAISEAIDLPAHGIAVAGRIALAPPQPTLPASLATWEQLSRLAAPIALILFAESWGTMRSLALGHGDRLFANRELAAIGLANGLSALAGGMPVGAGFSAGAASEAAGTTSRVAGIAACLVLLILTLFATRPIEHIPEPVLAAVVIGALTHALSPSPFARLFRLRRDQWVAIAAVIGVLALGVLNGMLAAIALSIAELLYRLSHPSVSELGRVGDGHDFIDVDRHDDAERIAGIAIFRPNAPLFFANAESVLRAIGDKSRGQQAHTLILSLEESADLDSTGVEALCEFIKAQANASRRVILARAHDRVRDVLAAAGATDLAAHSTYSVADAAAAAIAEK